MRWVAGMVVAVVMLMGPGAAGASERVSKQVQLRQVSQDAWNIATEPFKSVARETRRFDPITGLWFSLLEGSVKSIERTAQIFFHTEPAASSSPVPDWREARNSF